MYHLHTCTCHFHLVLVRDYYSDLTAYRSNHWDIRAFFRYMDTIISSFHNLSMISLLFFIGRFRISSLCSRRIFWLVEFIAVIASHFIWVVTCLRSLGVRSLSIVRNHYTASVAVWALNVLSTSKWKKNFCIAITCRNKATGFDAVPVELFIVVASVSAELLLSLFRKSWEFEIFLKE